MNEMTFPEERNKERPSDQNLGAQLGSERAGV
jgi:hypothetical protein